MRRRIRSILKRRPVISSGLLVIALVFGIAGTGRGLAWARWELFTLGVDRASSIPPSTPTHVAGWSFAFGDRAVSLRVPICVRELDSARGVDTRAMFNARGSLRAHYVAHVVRSQSKSAFVDSLSRQLSLVRRERGLDDDEYLELLVRAVQSLRHATVEQRVRLPVEVVSSGFGVCSEKALLLASLMVHEGYETGMWVFDSQNHVALGVRSDTAQFGDSGYAFIETTRSAFVGEYDVAYRAAGPVSLPPQFIALGGERRYEAGAEVEYILRRLSAARQQENSLGSGSRRRLVRLDGRLGPDPTICARGQAAHGLVSYIQGQTDDREAVFEWLLRSATKATAQTPPALMH